MKRMDFEKAKVKSQKSNVHVKCKMFRVFMVFVGLLVVLAACGKKAPERPASVESPKPPAPFSRGPTGPPKISAPAYPQP